MCAVLDSGWHMNRAFAGILAAVATASASAAAAQPMPLDGYFVTAGKLLESCTAAGPNHASWCEGFIAGVLETHTTDALYGGARPAFCATVKGRTLADYRAVVVATISKAPAAHDRAAASVVMAALRQAYPCPETAPAPGGPPQRSVPRPRSGVP